MIQRAILRHSRVACLRAQPSRLSASSLRHATRSVERSQQFLPLRPALSRYYSVSADGTSTSESSTAPAAESEAAASATETAENSKFESIQKELESSKREVIELKDKYLRSVADFRNLQERTKRDVSAASSFAIQRFAKDLLDSVDNLDRALNTVDADKLAASAPDGAAPNKDLLNLYDGLRMTETILLQTLKRNGLERFDPSEEGGKFDPNLHEATFQTPVEGKEDGTVFQTQQKGFTLHGRVLRAAKVGVVKNS
ncbi:MAG: hypothetical protein M1825_001143 [Sarcosagium campestre]|nr:MAG: hypothetical protein M1825_001143 [Sarcosagium campestre]